jgi:hypothetical protein
VRLGKHADLPRLSARRLGLERNDGMSTNTHERLSTLCFIAGFLSIAASIGIWFFSKTADPAHGERFGIFVGLWAPTFLILSSRLRDPVT